MGVVSLIDTRQGLILDWRRKDGMPRVGGDDHLFQLPMFADMSKTFAGRRDMRMEKEI